MMKAVELTYNKEDEPVQEIISIQRPTVSPNQVLIQVHFAALDTAADAVLKKTMTGSFIHAKSKPLVIGWHYSGTIIQKGVKVADLDVNDKVWGFLQYEPNQKQGSFSEYIVVNAEDCAIQPQEVDVEHLSAASTEALTALQAMRNLGGLEAGKSVLILGAAGGVGSAAVQIAKKFGAHVTAVCSTKDLVHVQSFGADIVIDRSKQDPFGGNSKYDIVFDTPAKYSASAAMRHLKPKGTYVVTLPSVSLLVGMFLSLFNGKKAKFISCHSSRADLDLVSGWLKDKSLQIDVDSTFPISRLAQALKRQNSPEKAGRVIVKVKDGWD